MPQLTMHPFVLGANVLGALVSDFEMTQKSAVVPHWPQILQQTLSRHGFKLVKLVPDGGFCVPGTVRPQTAFETGAGIGGLPALMHTLTPTQRGTLQSFQPYVFLLNSSSLATLIPLEAAIIEQLSSVLVLYTWQDPSGFGFCLISGRVPRPQHTIPPGAKDEQSNLSGLNFVNSAGVMPHLAASVGHSSLYSILRVWQVPSELGGGVVSGSVPEEQHTVSPATRVVQKLVRVLYLVRSV